MNHTPGPWKPCGFENLTVNDSEGNTLVACPGSSTGTLIEMKGNAHLIAAAPELLEALKALIEADHNIQENKGLRSDQAMYRIAALDMAERAIAKAEGKNI